MLLRALVATILLWHPGFSEATAYTALLVLATIAMGWEVLKTWIEEGAAFAFVLGAFTICAAIIVWHQTWVGHHTVLVVNFWLSMGVLALGLALNLLVASEQRSRRALRRRTAPRHGAVV